MAPREKQPVGPLKRLWERLLWLSSWALLACVVGAVAVVHFSADRYWATTVLIFGPTWPLLVAAGGLVCLSFRNARRLLVNLVTAGVVAWPLMGASLGTGADLEGETAGVRVRVVTCNLGAATDAALLQAFLEETDADWVMLQECSAEDLALIDQARWQVNRQHHLVLLSRRDGEVAGRLTQLPPGLRSPQAATWRSLTPQGRLQLVNLHLTSPRDGFEALIHTRDPGPLTTNISRREEETRELSDWVRAMPNPVIIAGDFNMPVSSCIYREGWGSFRNAFSEAGRGWGLTKYTRWSGIRIDHVLVSSDIRILSCRVGPDLGGDHRPVITDLLLPAAARTQARTGSASGGHDRHQHKQRRTVPCAV